MRGLVCMCFKVKGRDSRKKPLERIGDQEGECLQEKIKRIQYVCREFCVDVCVSCGGEDVGRKNENDETCG
ncbi:hypothetical protein COLO4_19550 [Corchorus olitorius]|uniref:Uncharacterized protein n=1 Tax=Corchorus olitorius TaxID=93759 RepID=A0A1R3J4V8_9ROSI|nr:hypothetical protein COLO4_19550 [Corchorus olitorius]